jgi:hypothetical protein
MRDASNHDMTCCDWTAAVRFLTEVSVFSPQDVKKTTRWPTRFAHGTVPAML